MNFANLTFSVVRPILHSLGAEHAHRLTILALKNRLAGGVAKNNHPALQSTVLGLRFPNPIGLAAGFDKNAEAPDALLAQGFGSVEIGTVTPRAQIGNAKPRLFRLREDQAIINRMGFNNDGHNVVLKRLEARRNTGGIVGVNIGANKDSDDRGGDYVLGIEKFAAVASYITVNISSPNTPGLRSLQGRDDLQRLLDRLNAARPTTLPMLLKIAPDLSGDELSDIAACCAGGAVDGVIISNTTISRDHLTSHHAAELGGLSGQPLFQLSTRQLADFYGLTGGTIPLIGVGGVSNVETAWAKICAGASLLQIYSALVYEGPALITDICSGLAEKLKTHGFENIQQAVGSQNKKSGK